ncbi:uncharacterized protein LOC133887605 [Phragmites australis]|uniref:uncharacterized protein LOC133887605 n=1 Tax=Phragmites australis TaxID=29695 RepID=UPI002D7866B6|nr:uncharacterized protein LOC133887605 [Phragmites australis]
MKSLGLDKNPAELPVPVQQQNLLSQRHKTKSLHRNQGCHQLTMSKKTVVRADLIGKKCTSEILAAVATIQGIKSMEVDHDKCTLTVVGVVDPVCIALALKKKCFAATIVSVEDDKPKEEKKDPCKEACEKLCKEKCDKACCKECKEKCEKACMEKCEKFCKGKCKWCDKGCSCSSCTTRPGCYYTPYAMPSCYC